MKRLSTIVIAAASILACLTAKAQGGADALPFVRTDFGPILTGTAGAAVASAEAGPWGIFRGASAMAFPGSPQGVAGELRITDGNTGFSGAALVKPVKKLGIGVGASYLGGDVIGDFKTHSFLLCTGIAYGITDNLSVGINTRFANQSLTETISYKGTSVDLNVLAKVAYGLTVTAGLSALGSSVESASGTKYSQPANAYAGAEYVLGLESSKLALDAMGEYYFSGNYGAAIGAAFTYNSMVTVRAGYRYASEWCVVPSHFAAGLEGRLGGFSLGVSFAKMPVSNIICISAGYSF